MSVMFDILAGRVKLSGATVNPALPTPSMDGGGPLPSPTPTPTPIPAPPMAPAPSRPAAVVPKNTPNTPPQPTTPGIKSSALSRAIKGAGVGLGQVTDFARGASVSAEELLRKNLSPTPDTYVASLQTQIPDYTPATPTRGPHAAAFPRLH